MGHRPDDDEPRRLLEALRAADCRFFIEDDSLYCSPPVRLIVWPVNPERAIEVHYRALKALVLRERLTVH